jgi:PST family polysaccharide transporter
LKFNKVKKNVIFTSDDAENLGGRTAKNGLYTIGAQSLKFCISTISTVVFARLLTPDDFGLIAMVAVIVNFAAMFKDVGLSMATIQKESITHEQISSLFWINVLVCFGLAILIVFSAPIVVRFYNREELYIVTLLLASSILISGFSIQHTALLKRVIRFDLIGIIEVGSMAIGLTFAILFALWKESYLALVFNTLFTTISMVLLTYYFIPWKPDFILRAKGVKKMLQFGGDVTGFNVINYFSRNTDNLLIGKYIGAESLGLYSKAYSIFMMPVRQIRVPINSLTIPVLSRLKDESERYARYCDTIVEILAIISIPMSLFCYLEAEFLINVVLGPGWEGAIPIFKILALTAPLQVILGIRGSIMLSMGFSRRYLVMGVTYACFTIVGFVIGLSYGIQGIALAFVAVQYLLFIPSLFYCFYETPFTVKRFFKAIIPQLPITLVAILLHRLNIYYFADGFLKHVIGIFLILIVFVIANALRSKVRSSVKLVMKQFKNRDEG